MKSALLLAGIAASLAVTGCSSTGSSGTNASESPSAAPTNSGAAGVCTSLTTAINAAVHATWKSPTETDNGTLHNCAFGPSDPGVLAIQIADGDSHAGFVDNRAIVEQSGAVANLSGLGDEAYTQAAGGAILVVTRKGDVGVLVQLQAGTKDNGVAIARAALSVLAK